MLGCAYGSECWREPCECCDSEAGRTGAWLWSLVVTELDCEYVGVMCVSDAE